MISWDNTGWMTRSRLRTSVSVLIWNTPVTTWRPMLYVSSWWAHTAPADMTSKPASLIRLSKSRKHRGNTRCAIPVATPSPTLPTVSIWYIPSQPEMISRATALKPTYRTSIILIKETISSHWTTASDSLTGHSTRKPLCHPGHQSPSHLPSITTSPSVSPQDSITRHLSTRRWETPSHKMGWHGPYWTRTSRVSVHYNSLWRWIIVSRCSTVLSSSQPKHITSLYRTSFPIISRM